MILGKPFAFVQRDFAIQVSYRFAFIMQSLAIVLPTVTFFFMSELFGDLVAPRLAKYGGDYFSFVLIGFAFSNYLQVSIQGLSRSIREGQMMGTLEALLVTQTEIPTIILSSSIYSFLWTSLRVVVFLLLGVFAFGIDISRANYGAAVVIMLLTITSFSSLGIISASFIMIFKRGDPIAWIFTSASWLLGGVYYPIDVLPGWLQRFSHLLPITYSLEGMRLALIQGHSFGQLSRNIYALVVFSVVMLPISVMIFRYAVRRAKVDGSLAQY